MRRVVGEKRARAQLPSGISASASFFYLGTGWWEEKMYGEATPLGTLRTLGLDICKTLCAMCRVVAGWVVPRRSKRLQDQNNHGKKCESAACAQASVLARDRPHTSAFPRENVDLSFTMSQDGPSSSAGSGGRKRRLLSPDSEGGKIEWDERKRRLLSPDSEGEKIEWDEFSDDESESVKEAPCAVSSRRRANPYPEWTSKLRARNAPQSPKNGGSISVFVSVPGSRIISLCMDPSDSIGVLQKAIEDKEAIPVDKQFLVFNGRPLEEGTLTLTKYGIGNDSVIQLYPYLPGGGSDTAEQETKGKRADSATLEDGATAPESMAFNLTEKIRTGLKLPAQAKVVTQDITPTSQGIIVKLSITFREEHSCVHQELVPLGQQHKSSDGAGATVTSGGDVLLTCNSPACFSKGASSSSDQTPPPPENPEPPLDAKAYQRQLLQPDVSISLPDLDGCK
eukprot:g49874.t1